MSKSLFNFYLDDDDKEQAQAKLARLLGDQPKGQLGAFLRIQTKIFIRTPDDKVNKLMLEALAAEYEFSQKKNKRSRL